MIIKEGSYDTRKPTVLYDNLFAQGTLTASSGVGENAISGTTWDFWQGTGASTLEVDLGVGAEANCLFVDAHNLFTVGSALSVEYWNGSAWVVIEAITPTDNTAIMVIFPDTTASKYRIGATGADIGVVILGKRLVFPQGVDNGHTAINHARRIDVLGGDSLNGQFTGQQIIKRSADTSMTFPLLDASWVDTDMAEFETHYDNALPFAFATNPQAYPKDMGYCQRPQGASELRPRYYEGGLYEEFTMALGVYQNV
jgi:hypothetical protein